MQNSEHFIWDPHHLFQDRNLPISYVGLTDLAVGFMKAD